MNERNGEEARAKKLEEMAEELGELFEAGELDFEELQQRLGELFTPGEATWLVHFVELPFELELPDVGEFTPWMGVVVDAQTEEMIFADMTPGEPEDEEMGLFLITAMTILDTAPGSIDVLDETIAEALRAPAAPLGIEIAIPHDEVPDLRQAMQDFANGLSKEEMMKALTEEE